MSTAKDEVRRILDELPEDVSIEDIPYEIYVRHKIAQGLRDFEEGRIVDQEEVERSMQKWLEK